MKKLKKFKRSIGHADHVKTISFAIQDPSDTEIMLAFLKVLTSPWFFTNKLFWAFSFLILLIVAFFTYLAVHDIPFY